MKTEPDLLHFDSRSNEGLNNVLLPVLSEMSCDEFCRQPDFILNKCINVNRSFSDAIEFLSIWLKKSPDILINKLRSKALKDFFNRTMYHLDGDQWHFPNLLKIFSEKTKTEEDARKILHNLFENFDFVSKPADFIGLVIGYNRLERCVNDSPEIFKRPLLEKILSMTEEWKQREECLDLGSDSISYLKNELLQENNVTTERHRPIEHSCSFFTPISSRDQDNETPNNNNFWLSSCH